MKEILLVNCKEKILYRGTIFRFKGKYPFTEHSVDWMICESPEQTGNCAPLVLYCVTGYYAGVREYVFPIEAKTKDAIAINTTWLVENWNKMIYDGCDVSKVKVIL